MKKKIAVFLTGYGLNIVLEGTSHERYTQITEEIEVDFPELPKETVLGNQIIAIDLLIDEAKQEAMEKMEQLNQRKQELLALTHEPQY